MLSYKLLLNTKKKKYQDNLENEYIKLAWVLNIGIHSASSIIVLNEQTYALEMNL